MSTLWHGRFDDGPSEELLAFTVSLPFDIRLAGDDIAGSRAHVRGLERAGILDASETASVLAALDTVEQEISSGTFVFAESDEDVHTAVERRITELAGAAGARLHTGRSRNDQVATDLRLFTKRELGNVIDGVLDLQQVLHDRAIEVGDASIPGYTHLQRAQPVLLAHHLLAHGWALARDVDRLIDARRRLDVSPLGAGALAGSSLPLQPSATADDLGFAAVFDNSLDAVSDRDFVAESLFVLALVGVHLSRLAEELILWSTDEFGFLGLHDAWSTGSSMLPQKKNPDIAELTRGKTGRLVGNLTGLLVTLKALPLAYNRDLQEDKEPLFDSIDTVKLALAAMTGLLASSTLRLDAMRDAADAPTSAATDLAEWLVSRGVPFRDSHAIVGALVRRSLTEGIALRDLVAASPELGPDAVGLVDPGVAVTRRTTPGGGGPAPVATQLTSFGERLAADRSRR